MLTFFSFVLLFTADAERMNQLSRRQVRVTKQHNEEVRELLRLMGIPCVVVSIQSIPKHKVENCESDLNWIYFSFSDRLHLKLKLNVLNSSELER